MRALRLESFAGEQIWQQSCALNLEIVPMALASARVHSVGTVASPRHASLTHGHRFVNRNAVRSPLPCGCLTHRHTCQKHTVTTAHAGCQGPASVGAMSTACTPTATPQACRGVNHQLFASAVRPSKRAASVSSTSPSPSLAGCLPKQRLRVIHKLIQQPAGRCAG